MLKTYRIIPLVFILFLFGFTLITVAPVLAEDSPEFVACQQIKPRDIQTLKNKKDCFRDLARALQDQSGDSVQSVVPLETSGGEVAELNARIAESESQVATLTTTNAQLQEYLRVAQEALVPLSASFRDLDAHVVTLTTTNVQLQEQLAAANAALEPLNARIAESESQVATLTTTKTQLQGDLRVAQEALVLLNEKVTQSHLDRETAVLANNACVARYTTDMERGNGAIVAVDILKDKLQIHEQGAANMGALLVKMVSHHAYHNKKSPKSSRSALVIFESMKYELSCMSSHVDDVAFCAKNAAERRACGQGGLSCE